MDRRDCSATTDISSTLNGDENKYLREILTLHVLHGKSSIKSYTYHFRSNHKASTTSQPHNNGSTCDGVNRTRSSFGVWGRRMSKKIDSFRRAGSRETICSISERSDQGNASNSANGVNSLAGIGSNNVASKTDKPVADSKFDGKPEKRTPGTFHRSPSPFKSFFIRMGSTGMLNSARSNRRSQNIDDRLKTTEKETLFRSCSTSQLNTSPTYVKGDDPSEGIDLQISSRKDKTVSCDNLAGRQSDDAFDEHVGDASAGLYAASITSFSPCDFGQSRNESPMRKSSSCDFKEAKKSSFPYAFLRSKLSVLPEERHGTFAAKDERLFKTASEEHFPALKIEETYTGTTTLGRRRTRNGNLTSRGSASKSQEQPATSVSKPGRGSYAEFRKSSARCPGEDRYALTSGHLERIDDNFQQEDAGCYSPYDSSPMSLRDLDMVATLRNHRRNSAPSGEQRLSSHYVSSNESGYDSDGPRGESAAASENEGVSLKCTDSSDTSSVIDSELEKPIRSSTPSECQEQENGSDARTRKNDEATTDASVRAGASELNDGIDGLRWHQSNSGRLLPSIHQTYDDAAMSSQFPVCGSNGLRTLQAASKSLDISPHRMRLQQDKSRFLSDIIQPPKRVRRCRLVQLHKRDPKESLGIRLAQQRLGELRYIVVQLESDGIAHRDGRLRLGDEIVEVEGKELRTLENLEEVQEFLRSFTGNKIRLMTAYEETVPQVYVSPPTLPGEYEYLENAKNLSDLSLIDNEAKQTVGSQSDETSTKKPSMDEGVQSTKRPDFLPLSCMSKERKAAESNLESATEPQHYLTRHIAKFEKGYGKPSLGFSVVGGRDSPRGEMGIFVRRVFPGGQADVSKSLFQDEPVSRDFHAFMRFQPQTYVTLNGDEIVSLNGKVLRGYTHQEVIELFKAVREGPVELEITRRHRYPKCTQKSAPC
ncbi:PDZ domain-containing protein 2 [Melipona quadrifasciata]|uniref:PDZ domain-containing protein 2 n=1 Tax=Melipona quadrifasciata TaxID=166423 RepID=A0A0M9A1M3_9HYME|nr:PDZ domain-containing protein 2 [Melipona quadrifasciata]